MLNVCEIETFGGNVRGHQHILAALSEGLY